MEFINQYSGVLITAGIILAVIVVALLVWRTISPTVRGRRGQRIGISEYHELDKMRRLVLVRRDNVEHLILIGGPQDVVIESGIGVPSQPAAYVPETALRGEDDSAPIPIRPAPRPAVFGDRRPPPLRAADPPLPPPRGRETDS